MEREMFPLSSSSSRCLIWCTFTIRLKLNPTPIRALRSDHDSQECVYVCLAVSPSIDLYRNAGAGNTYKNWQTSRRQLDQLGQQADTTRRCRQHTEYIRLDNAPTHSSFFRAISLTCKSLTRKRCWTRRPDKSQRAHFFDNEQQVAEKSHDYMQMPRRVVR